MTRVFGKHVLGAVGLVGLLAACNSAVGDRVAFRSATDRHCRGALGQVLGDKDYSIISSDKARRDLGVDGVVLAQTIVYQRGTAQRLFTCFYPASGNPPATGFTYRGKRLSAAAAAAANTAGNRR